MLTLRPDLGAALGALDKRESARTLQSGPPAGVPELSARSAPAPAPLEACDSAATILDTPGSIAKLLGVLGSTSAASHPPQAAPAPPEVAPLAAVALPEGTGSVAPVAVPTPRPPRPPVRSVDRGLAARTRLTLLLVALVVTVAFAASTALHLKLRRHRLQNVPADEVQADSGS